MSKYIVRGVGLDSSLAWRVDSKAEAQQAYDFAKKSKLFRYVLWAVWKDDKYHLCGERFDQFEAGT